MNTHETTKTKQIPGLLLLAPVLLILPYLLTQQMRLYYDVYRYQALGLKLLRGVTYTQLPIEYVPGRGPGFPLFLSLAYRLLAPRVLSTLLVGKLCGVLLILLSYCIGKTLYDRWTGLIAAILVAASSYFGSFMLAPHIDQVLLVFLALGFLLLWRALERDRSVYCVLTGVSWGIAYLVKETTLIYAASMAVTVFVLRPGFRQRRKVLGVSVAVAILLTAVAGWALYEYLTTGTAHFRLFEVFSGVSSASGTQLGLGTVFRLLKSVVVYSIVQFALRIDFPLLILAGWALAGYRAWRGSRSDRLLLSVSPALLFFYVGAAWQNLVPRQIFPFIFFSYLLLARFFVEAVRWLEARDELVVPLVSRRLSLSPGRRRILLVVLGLIWAAHLFRTPFFQRASLVMWTDPVTTYERQGQAVADWIEDNVPPSTAMMIGRDRKDLVYYFQTAGYYPMYHMPVQTLHLEDFVSAINASSPDRKLLFIGYLWNPPRLTFYTLFEDDLLADVAEYDIEYVIVDWRNWRSPPVMDYFSTSPNYEFVFEADGTFVYKVLDYQPSPGRVQPSALVERNKLADPRQVVDEILALVDERGATETEREHLAERLLHWVDESVE